MTQEAPAVYGLWADEFQVAHRPIHPENSEAAPSSHSTPKPRSVSRFCCSRSRSGHPNQPGLRRPVPSPVFPGQHRGHALHRQFREYWEQNGGLPLFGYPLSFEQPERNAETGQTQVVQWFERNHFEAHPENAAPYDVQLGLLGSELRHPSQAHRCLLHVDRWYAIHQCGSGR